MEIRLPVINSCWMLVCDEMAAATQTLAKSEQAVAILHFDNSTLIASSITMANIGSANPINLGVTLGGIRAFITVAIGQSGVLNLPAGTTVALQSSGVFAIVGLQDLDIGTA